MDRTASALAALLIAASAGMPAWAARAQYDFNPGWKLMVGDPAGAHQPGFDDRAWKRVMLPRAWNEDDAYARDIIDHSTGIAWYRKRFSIKDRAPGQKAFIEFEGAPGGRGVRQRPPHRPTRERGDGLRLRHRRRAGRGRERGGGAYRKPLGLP